MYCSMMLKCLPFIDCINMVSVCSMRLVCLCLITALFVYRPHQPFGIGGMYVCVKYVLTLCALP